ncbi:biotin carboxyl carrier domain-containing protein [Rubrobacter taiwanensis]|uniref:Biotin carboxyl carrier protein of acetyl-CoA carboxylase n=1 Tax=Rubrobacter taiwanensis TaxID=185139 RepID=A0A4R1BGV6_9ACTN|nr:acetyl-CoA carboxylase [Rubrobacter taiwanensis]TCJ16485.1 biotin carboxyl carrier domain-containing protein [Rubrobacter taiwanensis]
MAEKRIKSPLPGIFYRRPDPDSDPYVNEGDRVNEGDVVGIVGVMKSFHEIKADASGRIVRFEVENEDPVQAGQDIAILDG